MLASIERASACSSDAGIAVGRRDRRPFEHPQVERHGRAPHRGGAGDVHADEHRGDVVEVLHVADRGLGDEHDEEQRDARLHVARRPVASYEPHHHEHRAEKDHHRRAVHAGDIGNSKVEARHVVALAATAVRPGARHHRARHQHRAREAEQHPPERDGAGRDDRVGGRHRADRRGAPARARS